jgi:hypothetical protein
MCPQPPPGLITNPCLTTPVIGVYATGVATTVINFFLIVLILLQKQKKKTHYLLVLAIATATISITIGSLLSVFFAGGDRIFILELVRRIGMVGPFMFAAFYWFINTFLEERRSKITYVIVAYIATLLVASFAKPDLLIKEIIWNETLGYYELLYNPSTFWAGSFAAMLLPFGIFKLIRAYRKSRSVEERNRLKYLISALIVLLIGIVLILIPSTHVLPFDMIGATVMSILLTYASLRHNLVDITLFIRTGVTYLLVTGFVGILYFVVLSLILRSVLHQTEISIPFWTTIFVSALVTLLFQPLQTLSQKAVDRAIFKKHYDSQEIVKNLSQAFSKNINPNFVASTLLEEVCKSLGIDKAVFFLGKEEGLQPAEIKGPEDEIRRLFIPDTTPLAKELKVSDNVSTTAEFQKKEIPLEGLDKAGIEVLVPLKVRGSLKGVLGLGGKTSKDPYTFQEVDLLQTAAKPAILALENATLFSDLEKEKERVEKAKSALEAKVKERTKELNELNKELDQRVKDRTKEMEEKIEQLEKFQKLTVGREIKMRELKEEMERIQNKKEKSKKGQNG